MQVVLQKLTKCILGTTHQVSMPWIQDTLQNKSNTLGLRRHLLHTYGKKGLYCSEKPWSNPNDNVSFEQIDAIEEYARNLVIEVRELHFFRQLVTKIYVLYFQHPEIKWHPYFFMEEMLCTVSTAKLAK